MDKAVVTWIILVFAVALTLGGVAAAIKYKNGAEDVSKAADGKMSSFQQEISESDLRMYDGTSISGSEVVSVIGRYEGKNLSVKVTTGKGTYSYNYVLDANNNITTGTPTGIDKARTITDNAYINPTGTFKGSILRDSNDVITGLAFVQE